MGITAARTVSIGVERPPGAVYDYVRDPRNLPTWAPSFAKSVRRRGDGWVVETGLETLGFEFVAPNVLGVLDHRVTGARGLNSVNPMRVIANGDGSEVLFTLFQEPGMPDGDFARGLDAVRSDLLALKRVLERPAA